MIDRFILYIHESTRSQKHPSSSFRSPSNFKKKILRTDIFIQDRIIVITEQQLYNIHDKNAKKRGKTISQRGRWRDEMSLDSRLLDSKLRYEESPWKEIAR